jgi:hypothetical protein
LVLQLKKTPPAFTDEATPEKYRDMGRLRRFFVRATPIGTTINDNAADNYNGDERANEVAHTDSPQKSIGNILTHKLRLVKRQQEN